MLYITPFDGFPGGTTVSDARISAELCSLMSRQVYLVELIHSLDCPVILK